jgi:hypothetical protein
MIKARDAPRVAMIVDRVFAVPKSWKYAFSMASYSSDA